MIEYDYSKLKGKIRECFEQQTGFAQMLGISNASLSNKLNNKTYFTQEEIQKSIDFFKLTPAETFEYFFTIQVD